MKFLSYDGHFKISTRFFNNLVTPQRKRLKRWRNIVFEYADVL